MPEHGESSRRQQKYPHPKYIARRKARALMNEPFLDDNPMDNSPPGCSLSHFQKPHLRQCIYNFSSVIFVGHVNSQPRPFQSIAELGGGLDGYNWKIRFQEGGPFYVLKLIWDVQPPQPPHYFASQRECQNAALFQMMQAAVLKDSAEFRPILINPDLTTHEAAQANLFAFSDDMRAQNTTSKSTEGLVAVTQMPRIRQCYGWMSVSGKDLRSRVPWKLKPPIIKVDKVKRSIDEDAVYTAIVYEWIEKGPNDPAVVQKMADFLWHTGFAHVMVTKADNWENGVLLDHSDIVHCNGQGWDAKRFGYRTAETILREWN